VLSQAYLGVYPVAHIYGAQVVHSEAKHPPHVNKTWLTVIAVHVLIIIVPLLAGSHGTMNINRW
jgi:hypothetical protein